MLFISCHFLKPQVIFLGALVDQGLVFIPSILGKVYNRISQEQGPTPFLRDLFLFISLCMSIFAYPFVCAPCSCSAHRGQMMALESLELELQVVASCHIDASN